MLTLLTYLHRMDPFVVRFDGDFGIRWYGLAYIIGFVAAFLLVRAMAKRRITPLEPARVADLVLAVAIGLIAGGRLGYAIFYQPELITTVRDSFPYWDLLAIQRGGMASHGAVIGMVIAVLAFSRIAEQKPATHLLDLVALLAPIGIFFGRIANFINGELRGRPAPEDLPWAVKFPQEIYDWPTRHPEKLTSPEFGEVANKVEQLYGPVVQNGQWMLDRVVMATQQSDVVANSLEPLLTARHPSQLYAAALEGLVVFVVLAWLWAKPRKPGVIVGASLVIYPIVRVINEFFRQPDLHIGFQWLGLTRGQWLSFAMLAIGIACLVYWTRRDAEKIGGWRIGPPAHNEAAPYEPRP